MVISCASDWASPAPRLVLVRVSERSRERRPMESRRRRDPHTGLTTGKTTLVIELVDNGSCLTG